MNHARTALAMILSSVTLVAVAVGGPLNPPAGSVAPTGKTTQELFDKVAAVEPRTAINATNTPGDADSVYKITQRGSYYLTGNIVGGAGKSGIQIAASDVSIDLMGFELAGQPGSQNGVSTSVAGLTGIAVRNGSVRQWGGNGVDLGTLAAVNSAVVDVRAHGNTIAGIMTGAGCSISGCTATLNGYGFLAGASCTISGCTAYNNDTGLWATSDCTLVNCTVNLNTSIGILAGAGCTVSMCTMSANSGVGIQLGAGGSITGCSARGNLNSGILVQGACLVTRNNCSANGAGAGSGAGIAATGGDNRIEGNSCSGADQGIQVIAAGNIIIRNTCSGNTTNWDIAIGNALAPIVAASTNVAPVVGNTYASSLGSTDPNANFTY